MGPRDRGPRDIGPKEMGPSRGFRAWDKGHGTRDMGANSNTASIDAILLANLHFVLLVLLSSCILAATQSCV